MPTKRTRRARGRSVLTLDRLDIADMLSFAAGWQPPRPGRPYEAERSRWTDYGEFLADYRAVRAEFLNSEFARGSTRSLFAEWLVDRFGWTGPPAFWGWIDHEQPTILPTHRVMVEFREGIAL